MGKKRTTDREPRATETSEPIKAPEITPEEELELFHRIEAAETKKRLAFREMNRTKDAAKFAKDAYMAATEEVHKLAGARSEPYSLFAESEDGDTRDLGSQDADRMPAINSDLARHKALEPSVREALDRAVPDKPTGNGWRSKSFAAAAMEDDQEKALKSAGMDNLGELQDALDKHGAEWWRKLGIGRAMAREIKKTFAAYLAEIHADVGEVAVTKE